MSKFKSTITENVLKNVEQSKGMTIQQPSSSVFEGSFKDVYGGEDFKRDLERMKHLTVVEKNFFYGTIFDRALAYFGLRGGKSKFEDRISGTENSLAEHHALVQKYKNVAAELNGCYFKKKREIIGNGRKIEVLEDIISTLEKEKENIKYDRENAIAGAGYKDKLARIDLEEQAELLSEDIVGFRQQQKSLAYKINFAHKEIASYDAKKQQAKNIYEMSERAYISGREYVNYVKNCRPFFSGMLQVLYGNFKVQKMLNDLKEVIDGFERTIDEQSKILDKYIGKNPAENLIGEPAEAQKTRASDDSSIVDQALSIYHNI